MKRASTEERFWAKVNKDGPISEQHPELGNCWVWTGCRSKDYARGIERYGLFFAPDFRPNAGSHQIAWRLAGGEIPTAHAPICHVCDVPHCVRNDDMGTYEVNGVLLLQRGHLFQATPHINTADMIAKGRYADNSAVLAGKAPKGEKQGGAILKEWQVLEIRARYALGGIRQKDLAAEYGVSRTIIEYLLLRKTWKHI